MFGGWQRIGFVGGVLNKWLRSYRHGKTWLETAPFDYSYGFSWFPSPRDRPRVVEPRKFTGYKALLEKEPREKDGETTIVSRTSPNPSFPSTALFSTRSTRVRVRSTWLGCGSGGWKFTVSSSIESRLAVSIFHDKLVTVSRVKENQTNLEPELFLRFRVASIFIFKLDASKTTYEKNLLGNSTIELRRSRTLLYNNLPINNICVLTSYKL